ncbi:MAG: protein kinase [Myxococcota bacterium]
MRNLARILLLPFALVGVLLGAFGVLVAQLPDHPATALARSAVEVASRALVALELGLPRDLARIVEHGVGETPLGYAVLGVGAVLLAFCAGAFPDGGAPRVRKGHDAKGDEDDHPIKHDKKEAKRVLKEAQALRKQGDVVEAAELLWGADQLDTAAAWFLEAGEFARAAEIRHDQNRFEESAELHMQGENWETAGSIWAQQEAWDKAADCYLKANLKSVAAEMFEKAGKYREAARCYRESEFMRHAAAMYVKCKDWLLAAEALESVFVDEGPKAMKDPKKSGEMTKLVRQAGKLFLKAEQPDRAYKMFERGNCGIEAGEVATLLGQHEKAALHFRQGGDVERAAEALRRCGQEKEAARLLGQALRDKGDRAGAAEKLEGAGDFMEAGDLYRSLEQFAKAAECYARHHGWAQAAEMYQLAGLRAEAGDAFERAGRFTEAAECFALANLPRREADLLDKAGDFLRAGEAYHREGMDDEAISALQKIPSEDEDFGRAAAQLGEIFAARGQLPLAITKLQQAIGDTELTRDSVDGYYKLATIYEEDGKPREALEIYERVMAFDYHYRDVAERLAAARGAAEAAAAGGAKNVAVTDPAEAAAKKLVAPTGTPGGRYQIVGELGRGGMGIVYKVQDTALDRLVAFKVLPQALTGNEQAVTNFIREAQAAAKLNHPNIVTVYDTGEQNGRYYIAMEYVEGTTIKEILKKRGPISASGILHVLMQIAEALAYAHEKKVVHRDIKPANAMWTRDKKVKLMDFGLAKVVEEARNHTTVVAGTPYYMSPEQTLGKNVDHRTDIYSLGVTVFEMATGTVPFKEGNIPYHHVHTPPPRLRDLRPELPEALSAIVERCLEKDPAQRFQSAREILAEVRGALAAGSAGERGERP